jgi:hypothetical protein
MLAELDLTTSVPLQSPGTDGEPGKRIPPGSAALRAELHARQQGVGASRYRYLGHVDHEGQSDGGSANGASEMERSHPHGAPIASSARRLSGPSAALNVGNRPMQVREPQGLPLRPLDTAPVAFRDDQRTQRRPEADIRPGFGRQARDGPPPPRAGSTYDPATSTDRARESYDAPYPDRGYDSRGIPARNGEETRMYRRDPSPSFQRGMEGQFRASPNPQRHSVESYARNAGRFIEDALLPDRDYPARTGYGSQMPSEVPRLASSFVEQELAAMKQKIADLERLRALELSLYGGGSSRLSHRNASPSPPPLVPSHGYRDVRNESRIPSQGNQAFRGRPEVQNHGLGPRLEEERRQMREDRLPNVNSARFAPPQGPTFNEYGRDNPRSVPMPHGDPANNMSRPALSNGANDRSGGFREGPTHNFVPTINSNDPRDYRMSAAGRGNVYGDIDGRISGRQPAVNDGRTPPRSFQDRSNRGVEQVERGPPLAPQSRFQPARDNRGAPAQQVQDVASSRLGYRPQGDRR